MRWIDDLDQIERGSGLGEAVVWLASPDVAARQAAHPMTVDLADAASLGRLRGAARLLRRSLVRALGARALGADPGALRFERTEGATRLVAPFTGFVSGAARDGWSLVALGPRPLGVDLERRTPEPPLPMDLFHPEERARLAALSETERSEAFARLWVAKEAHAKAATLPLDAALQAPAPERVVLQVTGDFVAAVFQP